MKKLMTGIVLLSLPLLTNAQFKGLHQSVEAGVAVSFRPDSPMEIVPGECADLWYYKFTRYKYPSLRLRYALSKDIAKRWAVGVETGITFRYMEPYFESYNTYYSFPLAFNGQYKQPLGKKLQLVSSLHLGYQFKHGKYRYIDGKGGWIGSAGFGLKHPDKKFTYKFGYEIQQDRMMYQVNKGQLRCTDETTFHYVKYVNQVYFSVVYGIN